MPEPVWDEDKSAWAGAAAITSLTDSSGGTASNTIPAIGATYSQTEVRNALASLTAKVNAILAADRAVGTIAED